MQRRGRGREYALLGLAAAAAAALAWAAWLVGQAPDELAEAEVASTARVVLQDVTGQWDALRESDDFRGLSNGQAEPLLRSAHPGPDRTEVPAPDPARPRAHLALLVEARRLALRGAWAQAEAALEEARAANPTAADQPALRLMDLRLAHGRGSEEATHAAWDKLVADVPWTLTRDGRPLRLIAGWIAMDSLDEDRRQAFFEGLAGPGSEALLAGGGNDGISHRGTEWTLDPEPSLAATLEICAERWPEAAEILTGGEAMGRRIARAASRVLTGVSADSAGKRWTLTDSPLGRAAVRQGEDPFLIDRAGLPALLEARLALPAGFRLGVSGAAPPAGDALLPPLRLGGGGPQVTLLHSDPSRLVRAGVRRRRLTSWSLLGLGVGCIAAALAAAHAMRKERRVAELRSTFVAGISHDLRTPLASILLMAENLQTGRVGHERVVTYSGAIAGEAERLRRRVDDVLDFARIERGEPTRAHREEVATRGLVKQVLDDLEQQAQQANFAFHGHADDLPATVFLDPDALRRIAGNLGQNALRHSGGTELWVRLRGADGGLELVVEDDGIGIPASQRQRVLVPFERLERAGHHQGGTGLGLAIVNGLTRAHGGTLRIEPGPSSGTRFTIHLPCEEHSP